ncbi:MAG: carboxypeptidase regulatory-like domain-containing protein, partial [Acidobacteria bacterium]|nr:carboxypeptidase regulatory-like domain-containing protein [Acidobacteriota bacterium]
MRQRLFPCFCLAAILAVLVLAAHPASAQILYGSIVGNVKDPTDAAIAGAKVVITHKQTNQVRETTTNEAGGYSFPTISAGPYELRVTKEGFRMAKEDEVLVTINSVSRADLSMQLGSVTET